MQTIRELYEHYKDDVYYYLLSLTHDSTLAEDLTSETFLAAIKSLPNFRGEADVKTWLFSIARYTWYSQLRKRKEEVSWEQLTGHYLAVAPDLAQQVQDRELVAACTELLASEPMRTQEIVNLRIRGYSYYEIANRFAMSENSVRVINFRMREKFRQLLKEEGK